MIDDMAAGLIAGILYFHSNIRINDVRNALIDQTSDLLDTCKRLDITLLQLGHAPAA